MKLKLHLLGGSGRIGRSLLDSLISNPIDSVSSVQIYCDSTKVNAVQSFYSQATPFHINAACYSEFNVHSLSSRDELDGSSYDKHIVFNLRGINSKQQWLNQPLDSLELHSRSCRALVDANLWMHPGFEIFHFSSLLCDLIEGPLSLDDICQGEESYRRPYMVSRLHQEMILASNAYKHSISTSFLRMPAVYGFNDDNQSPWVLNSLCKTKRLRHSVQPRHTDRIVYLTHRDTLSVWLLALIADSTKHDKKRTVNYLRPPMLQLSVSTLAKLVNDPPSSINPEEATQLGILLKGDTDLTDSNISSHLNLLTSSILNLLSNDKN